MRRSIQSVTVGILTGLLLVSIPARGEVVWAEEFDGPTIDPATWTFDVGGSGFGNGELQYHTARSENVRIEDGCLVIEAKRESYNGKSFTSSRIKTHGRFAFKYGTLEARIKVPNLANGLWPAFWLLGNNFGQAGWPACGEVDILEMGMKSAIDAGLVNRRVHAGAFWDYQGNNADYGQDATMPADMHSDYHLYKLVWTPSLMTVYVDNTQVWAFDISNIEGPSLEEFHRPMYIIANLSVGGYNFVQLTDPAQITAPLPARMYIDYIRLSSDPATELYYGGDTAQDGSFGVYTETTPVSDQVTYESDAALYLWNNLTPQAAAPYEGQEAWSFRANAGAWFGMGVFCLADRNMSNYSDGTLRFYMKTSSTAPFRIGIASSAAGESWLPFPGSGDEFGLNRDGQWHEVRIPLNRFANVDFATIKQIFMLAGEAPSMAATFDIDDITWEVGEGRPMPAYGSFGVFTEDPSHKDAGEFELGVDGQFYVWENTLTPRPADPFEGEAGLALGSVPGQTWFGAAFTPNMKYNLTAFSYPESRLRFALKTSSNVTFRIGMKSGNIEDIGQKWIPFQAGSDPYGFVRDGQWHVIEIPMADFMGDVDLSQVSQLFELLGVDGPISAIEIDDVCFIGGGAPLGGGNAAPSVSITSPATGTFFSEGDDITIQAEAADTDGTIAKVEFFAGPNLLGEDLALPYSFTWNDVPEGAYTITVKATDNENAQRSASVKVYVGTPELTSLTVSPREATVEVGQAQAFAVTGADQFGLPFAVTPEWSVNGGGSIDADGVFTATIPGGPFTVTAQADGMSATAEFNVTKPLGACTGGPAHGEYTYEVSGDESNPTVTFVPGYEGVGSGLVILYWGTAAGGTYPGYVVLPNTPKQITAEAGQTVYFYYTYSVPEGGEHNTSANRHSVVVGQCSTSTPSDLNGDGLISLDDLEMLAFYWLEAVCDGGNDFCYGADTQPDGIVDLSDAAELSRHW